MKSSRLSLPVFFFFCIISFFLPSFHLPFISNNCSYTSFVIMHGNLKRQATSATSTRESRSGETVKRLKGQKSHGTRLQSTLALTSQTEQPQSGLQRILTGGSQNEEMSIEQGGDVVMVDEIKEQRVSDVLVACCHSDVVAF